MSLGAKVSGQVAVVDVEGCSDHLLVVGLRRGRMYIPDGINDVGVPWWIIAEIIECKSPLCLCTIFCNAYGLKLKGWNLRLIILKIHC